MKLRMSLSSWMKGDESELYDEDEWLAVRSFV